MPTNRWTTASIILIYAGITIWVRNYGKDSSVETQASQAKATNVRRDSGNTDVKILGKLPEAGEAFAIYSSTTDSGPSPRYSFYLPITALAWKRIGFRSIVVLVGDVDMWDTDKGLQYIKELLLELKGLVMLLPTSSNRSVMVSQVSRIYAADILHSVNPDLPDFYIANCKRYLSFTQ